MIQRCWECGRESFDYNSPLLHYVGCVHEVKTHTRDDFSEYVKRNLAPLPVIPPPSRPPPDFKGPWIRI